MGYYLIRESNLGDFDNPIIWRARISLIFNKEVEAEDFKRKLFESKPWLVGEVRVKEASNDCC